MSTFNQQKNLKAGTYTVVLLGSLLALCFIISWTPPIAPPVPEEEGMEVNLGDSETGSGDIQPLLPGDPALETEAIQTPPAQPTQATPVEKEIETNDNDKEAPPAVVAKPKEIAKPKAELKPIPETPKPTIKPKEEAKPVETPPAPKPKAIYKAQGANANGTGGNNADSYQPSKGQGIAGGSGDQGKLNGNPNSDSYTGNGGTGSGNGVSISRGLQGRKINRFPSFEDDFSENAKVAVDIKVDNSGNVISANIQPRGTTTGNASMKAIALRKARQLRFNTDDEGAAEQIGTITFSFRVRQ
jgi:outer membrane biosynthesis protein TonB